MKIELLVIDPQNDFCEPSGTLFVPGAEDDMKRLAAMVIRLKDKLDDIHVTLDSHHYVDIAHPIFWVDSQAANPDPFTIISADDVEKGLWRTAYPSFQNRARDYVKALETNKRYPLCIWPYHCLIGSWGYGVINSYDKGTPIAPLFNAFVEWEKDLGLINYVTKGSNFWTEHYSAVQADVPDPEDPSTQLNTGLIKTLQEADIVLLAGEARSHCLANTVKDIADNLGQDNIKKMVLLQDATSDVPDPPGTTMFTDIGEQFVSDMMARGMQVNTTVEFLK